MKNYMQPKIIPRIFGGLGNQLFIYAAARRLALVNNAELVIDDVSGFVRDFVYHRHYQLDHFNIPCRKATSSERLEPFSLVRRFLKRRLSNHLPFNERSYIQQEGIEFDQRLLKFQPKGTVYLEGYWQSELYFKDMENIIRDDLRIKPPTDSINLRMAEDISKNKSVAVHVRLFDSPSTSGINNVPANYYVKAVSHMENFVPHAKYFLFSNNPEKALALIPVQNKRITCVTQNQGDVNAYADLWLMTHCRHFIIANSTFSWWGAWLGMEVDKKVIAPSFKITKKNRITSWGFGGLLPKKWLSI